MYEAILRGKQNRFKQDLYVLKSMALFNKGVIVYHLFIYLWIKWVLFFLSLSLSNTSASIN